MPLQALPPLVLLKHLATDRCRDVEQVSHDCHSSTGSRVLRSFYHSDFLSHFSSLHLLCYQAIMADALNIWALSEIGQLDYACQLLAAAHYGMDLPRSATELRLILPETGNDTPIARALRAPSYSVDAPFDSKLNEPSMKWLMSVEMSEHVAALCNPYLAQHLRLSHARIMLRMCERMSPSTLILVADPVASKPTEVASKGKGTFALSETLLG